MGNKCTLCVGVITLTFLGCLLLYVTVSAEGPHRGVLNRRGNSLVIGFTSQVFYNVDPKDAIGLTKIWMRMVDRKMGETGETDVVIFNSLDEAEQALAKNEVDILAAIPEEYFHLRANIPLVPALTSDYGRHFYDELLLLVRGDSGITRIGQLRGKRFRIETGQKGSVPLKWLKFYLTARVSSDPERFFVSLSEYPKASQVIMPVFFGQAAACLASRSSYETLVELNPQLGHQLRVLEQSPGFATGLMLVRRDIRNQRRDAFVSAIRDMQNDPKGKQLLTLFRINRMVPFTPEHLASIEKLLKERRGKGESARRTR